MIIIKNSKELAKLVDKNKDLSINEDIRIEYQFTREELRDVRCYSLCLEDNNKRFNFKGGDFKGKKISYYAVFVSYNNIKCTSWKKRRENGLDPICLDGKLEIVSNENDEVVKAIKLLEEKGKLKDGKILI